MTEKFIGEFKFNPSENEKEIAKLISISKSAEQIPAKEEWNKFCIYEFNGRFYRPVTPKAEDNLASIVNALTAAGFSKAVKDGKRKPSSLKYAVQTYGVEAFRLA